VLPRQPQTLFVESVVDGTVTARSPVRSPRPDVAAAFPAAGHAVRSGFRMLLTLGAGKDPEIVLRALLPDGSRIDFAAVKMRGKEGAPRGAPGENSSVVLAYHRVAERPHDPWSLAVSPGHFAEQMAFLKEACSVVPIRGAVDSPLHGDPGRPAVAVSFDDGYADLRRHALPVLADLDIPAVIFVVTGHLNRTFWWDDLADLVLASRLLPRELDLDIGGDRFRFDLGDDASGGGSLQEDRGAPQALAAPPNLRRALYLTLWERLNGLESDARREAIRRLSAWAGCSIDTNESRTFSADELRQLVAVGTVELGGHTVSHPILSSLTLSQQEQEIDRCKADLVAITGRAPDSFAYPYGRPSDYAPETVGLVREAGFRFACTTTTGRITSRTEPLRLPRLSVRDWPGTEFGWHLWRLLTTE
jgi:peptidoglycan/xylan/chitin deacetylase (PgdA/CDA1 family)